MSSLVAEQVIWDSLNAYITSRRLEPEPNAMHRYTEGGLDALATFILSKVKGHDLEVAKALLTKYLYSTFDNPDHAIWSFVLGYVKDYWIPGKGAIIPN
jgi:hypothetical protein